MNYMYNKAMKHCDHGQRSLTDKQNRQNALNYLCIKFYRQIKSLATIA